MQRAIRARLQQGGVIPAHPLALTAQRELDESAQRALTRHYVNARVVGLAVGVHTTQFGIHDPAVGLYGPVLRMAGEELDAHAPADVVRIAGLVGPLEQVRREARTARELGYHAGLLSMQAWAAEPEDALLANAHAAAKEIPIIAFCMQTAIGGRRLSYEFWCRLFENPDVVAVKIAAFDRYQTIDVARAACASGRQGDLALYTGNDDNFVADLLTPFRFPREEGNGEVRFAGGLLGQWAVGTPAAVALFDHIRSTDADDLNYAQLLRLGAHYTDANGAIFDAANGFAGCIAGINEVLHRQGLVASRACLDPGEDMSPGQDQEITRVLRTHPHLWIADRMRAFLTAGQHTGMLDDRTLSL